MDNAWILKSMFSTPNDTDYLPRWVMLARIWLVIIIYWLVHELIFDAFAHSLDYGSD